MKTTKQIILLVASTGWIIPLFLGVDTIITFLRVEVYPRLLGQPPLNSFPFLDFSRRIIYFGFGWLAVVVSYWSIILSHRCIHSRAQPGGPAARR
jgi:hypothetical protein